MLMNAPQNIWPELNWADWSATGDTLHRFTQIVGKVRMAQTPLVNHWWNVTLYVTSRGLTTSPIPYRTITFTVNFDFIAHQLTIDASDGGHEAFALKSMPVAEFYALFMAALRKLGIDVHVWTMPCEIPDAIAFDKDAANCTYDPAAAQKFWRVLVEVDRVMKGFRAGFIGKVSPVHFFWGSFDLAVTRFSGRVAPPHPGTAPNLANWAMREAYSHEVSSVGFWPGNGGYGRAAFYSYAYPEPAGFADAKLRTRGAFYDQNLKEFVLPYDDMRRAAEHLARLGARAVLMKGGHLEGDRVVDLLFHEGRFDRFEDARIASRSTHGTGCTLASAIAAGLAQKMGLRDAVARARSYVRAAIETAPGYGRGHGPLNHAVTVRQG